MACQEDWRPRRSSTALIDRIYDSIRSFIVNLVGWTLLGAGLTAIAVGLSRLL